MQQHHGATPAPTDGRLGRLGAWAADHRRAIVIAWCGVVLVLGALAPFADRALSGAGWEATGSESVAARHALEATSPAAGRTRSPWSSPGARHATRRCGDARARPGGAAQRPGRGRRARAADRRSTTRRVVVGLAGAPPGEMVKAAGRLKARLARLSTPGVAVRLTGPAAMWSDFNAGQQGGDGSSPSCCPGR